MTYHYELAFSRSITHRHTRHFRLHNLVGLLTLLQVLKRIREFYSFVSTRTASLSITMLLVTNPTSHWVTGLSVQCDWTSMYGLPSYANMCALPTTAQAILSQWSCHSAEYLNRWTDGWMDGWTDGEKKSSATQSPFLSRPVPPCLCTRAFKNGPCLPQPNASTQPRSLMTMTSSTLGPPGRSCRCNNG